MQLPNADRAVVEPVKVRDYLLSAEHPVGRFKARVFASAGYARDSWPLLQHDLQLVAQSPHARRGLPLPYGQPYEIPAIVQGPNGRRLSLLTVWIVRTGEDVPRLVTAYPRSAP